jgi:alpha-beta hydrolase superfamily lysophospholipase
MYANARHVDLSALPEMIRTVEDPHPRVNRDIAHWIRERDMVLRGVNVTSAMRSVDIPLLVMAANKDGVVPVSAAFSAAEAWGGPAETLRIGTDEDWYAHACMFVGNECKTHVFDPMVDWLKRHS